MSLASKFIAAGSVLAALLVLGGPSPASAATQTFDTSQSAFNAGIDNQGWWSDTLSPAGGGNYFVGDLGGAHNNFFTFNLAALSGTVVSARLEVVRYTSGSGATETLGLFDVSTDAATLNTQTASPDPAIFGDLGSGRSYGTYTLSTVGDPNEIIALPLNSAAVADINASRGGFFSIGGTLFSVSQFSNRFLFGDSSSAGTQRLVVETISVPQTKADCKNGGWRNLANDQGQPFRNQGQCVSDVTAHRR
jgi:hypothetical protein